MKIKKSTIIGLIFTAIFAILLLTTVIRTEFTNGTADPPPASPEERARELAALTADSNGVDNSWALWLINAKNPIPFGYSPELSTIGEFDFDSRSAEYALLMIMAARNDDVILTPVSAYRSVERQADNFEKYFNEFLVLNPGYTREQAFNYTLSRIAVPYTSEHNAGLAIDFNMVEEEFDQTAEFRWLLDNAHKFGFIMRFPKYATDVTGIIYEPWHFRFVGLYHAERVRDSELTLEEYIGSCAGDDSAVEAFRGRLV
jgi:D-alanyl-D-alanine carboxypeptidase